MKRSAARPRSAAWVPLARPAACARRHRRHRPACLHFNASRETTRWYCLVLRKLALQHAGVPPPPKETRLSLPVLPRTHPACLQPGPRQERPDGTLLVQYAGARRVQLLLSQQEEPFTRVAAEWCALCAGMARPSMPPPLGRQLGLQPLRQQHASTACPPARPPACPPARLPACTAGDPCLLLALCPPSKGMMTTLRVSWTQPSMCWSERRPSCCCRWVARGAGWWLLLLPVGWGSLAVESWGGGGSRSWRDRAQFLAAGFAGLRSC